MDIKFVELTINNLDKYIDRIVSIESQFPIQIKSEIDDFRDFLEDPDSIGVIMEIDGATIGVIIGALLTSVDEEDFDIQEEKKAIYVYDFVIDINFQSKGYGMMLFREFINLAKASGFKALYGHFRSNTSIRLARKFSAVEIREYPDWENTDETYTLCRIEL